MSGEKVTALGLNVARYRKANKMSGDSLADLAGCGLTRSIIANLENGRKADLSTTQLLAVASILGVPPFALLVDIFDPGGKPEFNIAAPLGDPGATPESHPRWFTNYSGARWMAGDSLPTPDARTPAQALFASVYYVTVSYMDAYDRFFSRLKALDALRKDNDPEEASLEDEYVTQLVLTYEAILERRSELASRGIHFEGTSDLFTTEMLKRGIPLSTLELWGPMPTADYSNG